jgi:hypothetical protein
MIIMVTPLHGYWVLLNTLEKFEDCLPGHVDEDSPALCQLGAVCSVTSPRSPQQPISNPTLLVLDFHLCPGALMLAVEAAEEKEEVCPVTCCINLSIYGPFWLTLRLKDRVIPENSRSFYLPTVLHFYGAHFEDLHFCNNLYIM